MEGSDETLIQAIGKGNRAAFEALFKRYRNALFNFICRYLGERAAAEDITQEVFIRVFLAAPRFETRPGASASTWIYRIAYHLSLNEIKRKERLLRVSKELEDLSGGKEASTPAHLLSDKDVKEEILCGLRRLPENQRAALLLRVNEGLSYKEIGEVLGISVSSVESLLFRARRSLRQHLNGRIEE